MAKQIRAIIGKGQCPKCFFMVFKKLYTDKTTEQVCVCGYDFSKPEAVKTEEKKAEPKAEPKKDSNKKGKGKGK